MVTREPRTPGRWIAPIALLAIGAGTGWVSGRRLEGSAAVADPESWQTATVERRDIGATVLASGVVRPRVGAQVAVGSRASGILGKLHVTVGDRVRAGQLLAELDPIEFETQVERAQAQLLNARTERAWAEQEYDRIRQLGAAAAATTVEVSSARRSLDTALAREREATATLAAANVQLGFTRITAPIGGVVGSISTQEGETVAASFAAPTFLTIVDLDRLEVWAWVDETDIGRIEVGQPARFTVDTWPDESFEGRVSAIRPIAEIRDNVVNYITIIEFESRPGRVLRPEMTTTVGITLEGRSQAISVPNSALRRDADGTYVLERIGERLERRDVTIGLRGSDFTEVLSGAVAGESVVLGATSNCGPTNTSTEAS
jgi:HlyD family secretion protein